MRWMCGAWTGWRCWISTSITGNGTQALLWDEARTLFASSQQYPHWPGTGASRHGAHDNVINAPLPPESDGRAAWDVILARVAAFRPQLVILLGRVRRPCR